MTISPKEDGKTIPNRFWDYVDGPQLRMYSGTLTITATTGKRLKRVHIVNGRWNNYNTVSTGTMDNGDWVGDAQSLVVTFAGNTQISEIIVGTDPVLPEVNGIGEFKSLVVGTKAVLTLQDAKVTAVKGDSIWIEDEGGAILFQNTGLLLSAGKSVSGTITARYRLYYGTPHLYNVISSNLTQVDAEIKPTSITVNDAIQRANICRYVEMGPVDIADGVIVGPDTNESLFNLFNINIPTTANNVKVIGLVGNEVIIDGNYHLCFCPLSIEKWEEPVKLEQTLSLTALPSMTYGDATYTFPATTIEGLNITWTIDNNNVASITDHDLTIKGAGTATVTATQAGNDSYLPFTREFTLTVSKAALTITAKNCSKNYGEDNPELAVSFEGFKYNDDITSLKKQPTLTTTATKTSPAGEYPITASGAEADNYTLSYVAGKLTILKVEQALSLTALPAMTYGDAAYTLPAKTDQSLALTWKSSNTAVAAISSGKLTIKGAGTATVTATQAGNTSYQPFTREFTLTVGKASLTITADNKTKVQGEEMPELTVSYQGFKNGDGITVLKKQPTVTTTATKDSPAGTYPITVSGAEAQNYIMNYVSGRLTVTPAPTPVETGNTLYVADDFSVHQGENATLGIRLDNEDDIIMAEFYLQLPEGIHVNKDADGYFDVTLNSDRADRTHTVEVEQGANGLYHVVAYSSRNKAFIGSKGELITMSIGCDATVGAGTYQGVLRNILMSKADKTAVEQGNRTFDIEVTDYILGDVNDDRRINGLDIVEMVDLVMGMGYKAAADLYPVGQPDGVVNGMDLVEEVELVLSQTIDVTNAARQAESKPLLAGLTLTPTMSGCFDLGVNTADRYLLAQFTLQLSDGMMLDDIETDGSHVAAFRPMGEGRYSVVVYSARNRSFTDNQQLLTLHCMGDGEVSMTDVMLVDDTKQACHFTAVSTGEATGIWDSEKGIVNSEKFASAQTVYDLQGRKQSTIQRKGVYLTGNRKVVVK